MNREIGTGKSIPEPVTAAFVAVTLLAVALLQGGFPPRAGGALTVAVWLVVLAALLRGLPARPPTRASLLAGSALAALAALTAFSLGWAPEHGAAFEEVVRISGYVGLFALVTILAPAGSGRNWLMGLAAGGVAIAVVALAPRLLGIGQGDTELAALLPAAEGRLSHPIGYWNALGSAMAICLALLVSLGGEGGSRRLGAAAAAAIPLPVLTIYLTSSRGAVVAALVGLAIAVGFASRRRRTVLVAASGLAAGLAVTALAAGSEAVRSGAGGELTAAGLAVGAALVVFGAAAALAVGRLWDRGGELRIRRPRTRTVAIAGAVVLAALVAVGPDLLVGDLRGEEASEERGALGGGSGRTAFWGTALDGFASDPLRGLGAGGFEQHWNAEGSLSIAVSSVHSAPLELLAELGVGGLAALLAFAGIVGVAAGRGLREAGPSERAGYGAALVVLGAGAPGILLDWTWDVPAVFGQLLVVSALVTGRALRDRPSPAEPVGGRASTPALARPAIAAVAAAGLLAFWVGATLFVFAGRLEAGRGALGRGDVVEAARQARAAAEIQPRSVEPRLMLAEIEQAAGNLEAARRQAELAARLDPEGFGPWLLLSRIHVGLGEEAVGTGYMDRARRVAPRVLPRALRRQ